VESADRSPCRQAPRLPVGARGSMPGRGGRPSPRRRRPTCQVETSTTGQEEDLVQSKVPVTSQPATGI